MHELPPPSCHNGHDKATRHRDYRRVIDLAVVLISIRPLSTLHQRLARRATTWLRSSPVSGKRVLLFLSCCFGNQQVLAKVSLPEPEYHVWVRIRTEYLSDLHPLPLHACMDCALGSAQASTCASHVPTPSTPDQDNSFSQSNQLLWCIPIGSPWSKDSLNPNLCPSIFNVHVFAHALMISSISHPDTSFLSDHTAPCMASSRNTNFKIPSDSSHLRALALRPPSNLHSTNQAPPCPSTSRPSSRSHPSTSWSPPSDHPSLSSCFPDGPVR